MDPNPDRPKDGTYLGKYSPTICLGTKYVLTPNYRALCISYFLGARRLNAKPQPRPLDFYALGTYFT